MFILARKISPYLGYTQIERRVGTARRSDKGLWCVPLELNSQTFGSFVYQH